MLHLLFHHSDFVSLRNDEGRKKFDFMLLWRYVCVYVVLLPFVRYHNSSSTCNIETAGYRNIWQLRFLEAVQIFAFHINKPRKNVMLDLKLHAFACSSSFSSSLLYKQLFFSLCANNAVFRKTTHSMRQWFMPFFGHKNDHFGCHATID